MTKAGAIFLAAGVVQTIRNWSGSTSEAFQSLVYWGSFGIITLLVFGWAVIFRKQSRLPRRHHRRHRDVEPAMNGTNEQDKRGGLFARLTHKHRKRKKRRRANPTLAETGGLPEARDRKKQPPAPIS